MSVRLVYFAWVREKIGKSEETIDLPQDVKTVADLVVYLRTRGEEYVSAFHRADIVRCALDQNHVKPQTLIGNAREIAFFPPVTGG